MANRSEREVGAQSRQLAGLMNSVTTLSSLVAPNPSLNRTRYGRQRKAGAQRLRHCRAPALRCLPPRAG